MSAQSSKGHGRTPWLDEKSETPLIDDYVQRLGSFLEAMVDGRIEASELDRKSTRLNSSHVVTSRMPSSA